MHIRPEQTDNVSTIHQLTTAAFAPKAFSDGDEADIIDRLRAAGDLTLSLVAEVGASIHGHIAFSPVTIDGRHDGWYGLGPVSVWPERQGQGIGRALIETGLAHMRDQGATGIALIGNPALYGRFGFVNNSDLTYKALDPRHVHYMTFRGADPAGALEFAPAFSGEA